MYVFYRESNSYHNCRALVVAAAMAAVSTWTIGTTCWLRRTRLRLVRPMPDYQQDDDVVAVVDDGVADVDGAFAAAAAAADVGNDGATRTMMRMLTRARAMWSLWSLRWWRWW